MRVRTALWSLLILSVAAAVELSAQSTKFQAEQNRLHQEAVAARQAKGLGLDSPELEKQYPAAKFQEVRVQKVAPGASVAIALAGSLPAGVVVLSERDGATLSGATTSRTNYSARLAIGATEGPGYVKLVAFTPVSFGLTAVPVAFIDTVYRFDLKSPDGLTLKIVPTEKTFALSNNDRSARLKYQAEYYKPGETKPFQVRSGTMDWSADEDPRTRIDISFSEQSSSTEAEIDEISKKLADPKLTSEQRGDLMVRLVKAQQQQMEAMMKADPAAEQKKIDDFGCRLVQVYPGAGAAVKASVVCGQNFYKGVLETTGTMTVVR